MVSGAFRRAANVAAANDCSRLFVALELYTAGYSPDVVMSLLPLLTEAGHEFIRQLIPLEVSQRAIRTGIAMPVYCSVCRRADCLSLWRVL